ncbi:MULTISPECIES: PA3496 family putative envelope integrity protein [unclassified Pseudomonas]|uniref:PA3496 family putative envelope integrity protein n=1 Tax=unclassified Pseudomonas TaxID=196821 RepID=UPI000BD0F1A2|nr:MULTISPECIES: hypothetical protein [unclassified Pseudomonas]PVZ10492.1 hypothetical protein F474_04082 [Pseudomonas sp. URIL14HWK12:I12]PVZ21918.1 hypothetical protein F470_04082 [Pseudomonas sp. URIL14HWK12:I10]PVZ30999.1 hypothetical protein F472_04016 [Pseudomonas sp. URIL14HWK12:I11]SNZ17516.1 hypothetical protein SAMN05660463_03655 [Pseudomonas sp. URIL14HWK12:I9]
MARSFDVQVNSKTRRQQEDARRMAFRRAIECREDERRLNDLLSDFPDSALWQGVALKDWQSAQPAH